MQDTSGARSLDAARDLLLPSVTSIATQSTAAAARRRVSTAAVGGGPSPAAVTRQPRSSIARIAHCATNPLPARDERAPRSRRAGVPREVGLDHHLDERVEAHRRLPAELLARLGRIADEQIDLGRPVELRDRVHEVAVVETDRLERGLAELRAPTRSRPCAIT